MLTVTCTCDAFALLSRSTQLDVWTWLQLRAMQVGGNAQAVCSTLSYGMNC